MTWQKMVLMFLMVLILNNCAGFPEIHPYVLSIKNNQCGEYEIISKDKCDVKYKFKQWHPISDCENFFALSAEDVVKIREYAKSNCGDK